MDARWSYGEALPPRDAVELTRIVRCPSTGHCDYLLLGESLFVVKTHYDEVSVPCEAAHCAYCATRGWPSRLEGYISAVVYSPRERVVLAVSEFVCYQFAQIAAHANGLRGIVVRLRRGASRPGSPIYASYERDERDRLTQPEPDIHPILARVWGRRDLVNVRRGEVVLDGAGPHGAQSRRLRREGGDS